MSSENCLLDAARPDGPTPTRAARRRRRRRAIRLEAPGGVGTSRSVQSNALNTGSCAVSGGPLQEGDDVVRGAEEFDEDTLVMRDNWADSP